MGKPRTYQPLIDHLAGQPAATTSVSLTLADIEGLLGEPLPRAAGMRSWWHRSAPRWRLVRAAGWQVELVVFQRRVATFVLTAAATDSST